MPAIRVGAKDYDDHWRLAPVSGHTNRFYVYQDVNY